MICNESSENLRTTRKEKGGNEKVNEVFDFTNTQSLNTPK